MTLDEALGRLAEGDDTAFDEIYQQTRKTVYYIALSYVRERMLAEDVMQTVYLKVLRAAARYRRGTNATAWIARIARNESIDLIRRRSREVSVDERENPLPFGMRDVDDYGLLIDLARRILKQEEFSVLMLTAVEGYKRREIAQMLAMPLPTVTWHYSRAVKKMQLALKEEREQSLGGVIVDRRELERELRKEALEHTPDVYDRVKSAAPLQEGEVLVKTHPRTPLIVLACAVAGVLFLLACILPFVLRGSSVGNANLYISINPSVEFIVEDDQVTGVKALNPDAATAQKNLITADGIGVYATGKNAEDISRRVRDRLTSEYGGTYSVNELTQSDLEALLAAYDEKVMGDFEDYLENELSYLREGFAQKVRELLTTYLTDLDAVFADTMTREDFNLKYLYLGEDCIFEDGDESREDLSEEFEELRREIERFGDDYIYDELYDEFLEAVEETYENQHESNGRPGGGNGPHDDDDDDDDDD